MQFRQESLVKRRPEAIITLHEHECRSRNSNEPVKALLISAVRPWNRRAVLSGTRLSLRAAAFRGPIDKILHLMLIHPEHFYELGSAWIFSSFAQKAFQPQTKERAVPRMYSVTGSRNPVVSQQIPHRFE